MTENQFRLGFTEISQLQLVRLFSTSLQTGIIQSQSLGNHQKRAWNPGFWYFTSSGGLHTPENVPYYHNTVSTHVLGHTRVHSTHFPWLGTVKRAPKCDPAAHKKSRFTTVSPETSLYLSEMSPGGGIPSLPLIWDTPGANQATLWWPGHWNVAETLYYGTHYSKNGT